MNLDLAITYGNVDGFPEGSAVAAILVTITGQAAGNQGPIAQSVAPGTAQVVFPLTVADTYSYTIEAVDNSTPPKSYGNPVTGTFAIAAPTTVTLSLPVSAVASQS